VTVDPLGTLQTIAARHLHENVADWQFGLDGQIRMGMFLDLLEATHVDASLQALAECVRHLIATRPAGSDEIAIAGPKRGNSLLIREVARLLPAPSAFVKEQPLCGKWIEGNLIPGCCVVLVDDVASDGDLLVTAAERLRDAGHTVSEAFVLVNRPEGDATELLADHAVRLSWLWEAADADLFLLRQEAQRGPTFSLGPC
jgi:orotate phosphoribosyltransferase